MADAVNSTCQYEVVVPTVAVHHREGCRHPVCGVLVQQLQHGQQMRAVLRMKGWTGDTSNHAPVLCWLLRLKQLRYCAQVRTTSWSATLAWGPTGDPSTLKHLLPQHVSL